MTDDQILLIAKLVKGQPENRPITWADVMQLAEANVGHSWTRQALQAHEPIKDAYQTRAQRFQEYRQTGKSPRAKAPEIVVLQQKLDKEKVENAGLRETLRQYDERLCTYFQNALRHGISPEQLEAPLVPPYRSQTDRTMTSRSSRKR